MTTKENMQYLRRGNLYVVGAGDEKGLDLSEMHFTFKVSASDEQSPNTAMIRVYNLSADTVRAITGKSPVEYTRVVLQAGYEDGPYGVIFDGTIKQFRKGRENATDTYLDILAAAGDVEYNWGVVNKTLAAGSTADERAAAIAEGMGLSIGHAAASPTGGVLPRGKVLWGMGRDMMRNEAVSRSASWNIQDGKVNIVALTGYLPGEAVVLNMHTGLVGLPEQTQDGVRARCLINPRLRIGGLVQIDNTSINQLLAQESQKLSVGQVTYNQWAGLQFPADVTNDGFYRLYVVEYTGDSRGQDWYCDLIGLAVDPSTQTVKAYG